LPVLLDWETFVRKPGYKTRIENRDRKPGKKTGIENLERKCGIENLNINTG